jgi:hypothetical protein
VLFHHDSSAAPQTVQTASPVCGTKNFVSVRLYSAPQLHRTIVAIFGICARNRPFSSAGVQRFVFRLISSGGFDYSCNQVPMRDQRPGRLSGLVFRGGPLLTPPMPKMHQSLRSRQLVLLDWWCRLDRRQSGRLTLQAIFLRSFFRRLQSRPWPCAWRVKIFRPSSTS